ncbi:MAG: DDE-type integrase/transposase/recombinase [Flavobacteriales bacterium]
MIFVDFDFIESFGVSEGYVKKACFQFRQGKTESWSNKKDPSDKRKVLIDLDSIPEQTRLKYNIPTSEQYLEQQAQQAELENEKRRKETKKRLELLENEFISTSLDGLYMAYKSDWAEHHKVYLDRYSTYLNKEKAKEKATLRAKQEAFWRKMIELSGGVGHMRKGKLKDLYAVFLIIAEKKKIDVGATLKSAHGFGAKLNRMKRALKADGNLSNEVAHKKEKKGGCTKKSNVFHKALAFEIMSQGANYSFRLATEIMNNSSEQNGFKPLSVSWMKDLFLTNNLFKTIVQHNRKGLKYSIDNIFPYTPRENVLFPGNVWMIDGTPIQFYCWNKSRTRKVRLNLFLIVDVCTKLIVGFDVSYNEDRWNVLKSLKMAVNLTGHLPKEIVSDNFSASKSEEIKALKTQFEHLGVWWRHAKVGNPADKSQVERLIGTLQSEVFSLYGGYMGEGITSIRRVNRPSREHLGEYYKKNGYLSFNEMSMRLAKVVSLHNEGLQKELKSPIEKYNDFPKPNAVELTAERIAMLFWATTKHTVRRGMIHITVKKIKYIYTIYEHELKAEYQGKQVLVRYDENDLSEVMVFDKSETFLCVAKQTTGVKMSQAERTEEDDLEIMKSVAHKKSYEDYLKREGQKIIDEGLEFIEADELSIAHPLSLDKYQLKTTESKTMIEYFMNQNDLTEDDVEPVPKTLSVIKHSKTRAYEDIVKQTTNKKGSCEPVVSPQSQTE